MLSRFTVGDVVISSPTARMSGAAGLVAIR
jgi:hypothetical protein